ncbi:hypothetical protein CY34DRAFT_814236, partial [Suillus luteus UH-Slu-Lm8-n1]
LRVGPGALDISSPSHAIPSLIQTPNTWQVTYAAACICVKQIVPRHGRVKTHSCRVTAASIRLCRVTLTPRQCRIKPAHQHFSC